MEVKTKVKVLNFFRQFFLNATMEKLLYGIVKRKFLLVIFEKIIPTHIMYSKPSYRTVQRNGINYKLDLSSFNNWAIFWEIPIELEAKRKLFALIKEGNNFIDIGAHIGQITLEAARIVGDTGKVYSFEPHPKTFAQFDHNVGLNRFNNITKCNFGLGDEVGKFYVEVIDENNAGMNRISKDNTSNIAVEVKILDDFLATTDLKKIDFVKVDVEGFEYKALKGGEKALRKWHPILFIELDDVTLKAQNSSPKQLLQFLNDVGYTKIVNVYNDQLVYANDNLDDAHFDIFCYK
jgi:FkbM family methyltransferase